MENPFQPKENLWMMHPNFTICTAEERIKGNTLRGRFSLHFADLYHKNGFLSEERQLIIVQSAVGGTGFVGKQWGHGQVLSNRMFQMTKEALSLHKDNKIVAFLWHQGEHDVNHKTDTSVMYEQVQVLLNEVNRAFSTDFPLISGDFTTKFKSVKGEQADNISKSVKKAFHEQGGYFVETHGLLSNQECVDGSHEIAHFSRNCLPELAERYFHCCEHFKKGENL